MSYRYLIKVHDGIFKLHSRSIHYTYFHTRKRWNILYDGILWFILKVRFIYGYHNDLMSGKVFIYIVFDYIFRSVLLGSDIFPKS